MFKKIFFTFLFLLYTQIVYPSSSNNDVLMRMYERLEMLKKQMQDLIEENQQISKEILNIKKQQERLYEDLSIKIKKLQNTTDNEKILNNTKVDKINDTKNSSESVKTSSEESELNLPHYVNNDFKKNLAVYKGKSEIDLYRSAFQNIKDKNYTQAINEFNAFLYLFAKSSYASNAQYWLSESIYAVGDYKNAMINFLILIKKYPNSSKIADSKLKIGYCYYYIKDWKEARSTFKSIIKDYPNTSLSQLAEIKIKSMNEEGL